MVQCAYGRKDPVKTQLENTALKRKVRALKSRLNQLTELAQGASILLPDSFSRTSSVTPHFSRTSSRQVVPARRERARAGLLSGQQCEKDR
jgi:hypothetical protein